MEYIIANKLKELINTIEGPYRWRIDTDENLSIYAEFPEDISYDSEEYEALFDKYNEVKLWKQGGYSIEGFVEDVIAFHLYKDDGDYHSADYILLYTKVEALLK